MSETIQCDVTTDFPRWLAQAGGSLVVTTYQFGKVAFLGWDGEQVSLLLRHFPRPMGLAVRGQQLALALRQQLWLFTNVPQLAAQFQDLDADGRPVPVPPGGYDALYLPRLGYFTGGLDVHDLAFAADGLWLVNTRFGCLATLSPDYSFLPRWRPPFLTELAPEDRCHLNGLAVVDGQPRYVTALGETDTPRGWRPTKASGGILMDVPTSTVALRGLSMPHSPRWHDGRLWFLNSGAGELCLAEPAAGRHTVVAALPGFLRGLCFVGPYAVVGLSKIREKRTFGNLPIETRFPHLTCGVAAVDTRNGRLAGMLEFTAGCTELYEVQFLPGVYRPMILNLERGYLLQTFSTPEFALAIHADKDG